MELKIAGEYGYVVAVASASWAVCMWMGIKVGQARKQVKYPNMYADKKDNKDADAFNCVQRAHQNTLENMPHFIMFLLLAGLQAPVTSAILGTVYLAGRIAYALGYYQEPGKRMRGGFMYIGLLGLIGLSGTLAYKLIASV